MSNVFYNDFKMRLSVVESITKEFYRTNDNEFCGLHAIYLSYLYALTQQRELAENSLLDARSFLGNNLIYNHMILHNEATIKFHSQQIDEDIPILLNNAKITAYDEYDQFAINNNYKEVTIAYDYQGIESWALGTWKRNNKITSEYNEYMQNKMKEINIRFKKIKGHSIKSNLSCTYLVFV